MLGVINIYLKEGHPRDDKEVEFLNAIANALAGVIRRGKTEAALQESEKRYRILAEAAHDVIFIVNREGRIEYINSYGAELFQREAQALIGEQLWPISSSRRKLQARQQALTLSLPQGYHVYVENPFSFEQARDMAWDLAGAAQGQEFAGSTPYSAFPETSRQRRRFEQEREKLILDLQAALQTISRSHKEWQDTFDSITDMIAIIGKDFRIMKANKAFAGYFGLHPREMINRKCFEFYHRQRQAARLLSP